jgi:membrane-associated phospholipid phosphatase
MDEFLFIGPTFEDVYHSFPSGHTAVAFCFAYILARHFPKHEILFFIYAVIVAWERVEDKSHFPSDVLAGAFVGLIIGKILLKTFNVKPLTANSKIVAVPSYGQDNKSQLNDVQRYD